MSFEELVELYGRVKYPFTSIGVWHSAQFGVHVQLSKAVFDAEWFASHADGFTEGPKVPVNTSFAVSYEVLKRETPQGMLRLLRAEIRQLEMHECDELIVIDGKRPFNPHLDSDAIERNLNLCIKEPPYKFPLYESVRLFALAAMTRMQNE